MSMPFEVKTFTFKKKIALKILLSCQQILHAIIGSDILQTIDRPFSIQLDSANN